MFNLPSSSHANQFSPLTYYDQQQRKTDGIDDEDNSTIVLRVVAAEILSSFSEHTDLMRHKKTGDAATGSF